MICLADILCAWLIQINKLEEYQPLEGIETEEF